MKILIPTTLAAAMAFAAPAFAQTAPDAAPATTMPSAAMPSTDSSMSIGGYGPASTTLVVPAGAKVVYQQAPTPDQAYPAPAPLAKYPVCKRGQTDKCIERGGK